VTLPKEGLGKQLKSGNGIITKEGLVKCVSTIQNENEKPT